MRALAIALAAWLPAAALAQDETPPIPEPEIPDRPNIPREPRVETKEVHRYTKDDYPTEVVLRPMTLAEAQAQLELQLSFLNNDGNGLLWPVVRGAFGLTRDWELGFTYAAFLARFNPASGEDGIEASKAFSIDGGLTVIPDWLAVRLRLAFYADPDFFGFGLVAGVPFRWRIVPRVALFAGHDLLYIKVAKLAVDPADPARNLAEIANIVRGVGSAGGRINLSFGALWQVIDTTAVYGAFAIGWEDFSFTDQPYSLYLGVTHSPQRQVDLGLRLGFRRLEEPGATFVVDVYAALRL